MHSAIWPERCNRGNLIPAFASSSTMKLDLIALCLWVYATQQGLHVRSLPSTLPWVSERTWLLQYQTPSRLQTDSALRQTSRYAWYLSLDSARSSCAEALDTVVHTMPGEPILPTEYALLRHTQ